MKNFLHMSNLIMTVLADVFNLQGLRRNVPFSAAYGEQAVDSSYVLGEIIVSVLGKLAARQVLNHVLTW